MWINKFSRIKTSLFLLVFTTFLLALVSITFGTINLSASGELTGESDTVVSPSHSQIRQLVKNKKFAFPLSILNNIGLDSGIVFTVNNPGDTDDVLIDGICQDISGNCTLRAALQEANAQSGVDEIKFSQPEPDAPVLIQLSSTLNPKRLDITEAVKITGLGSDLLTVRGNTNTVSIFNVTATAQPTIITGISLINSGGNAVNNSGNLKIVNSVIKSNATGINNSGTLEIDRVTLIDNTSSAVRVTGASVVNVLTSVVSANSASGNNTGAAFYIGGTSSVNILNTQIDNNATTHSGSSGGLYIDNTAAVNISNTTITDNSTPGSGGGIYTISPNLTLNNVTVSHNTAGISGTGIYYGGSASGVYVRNTLIGKNKPDNLPDIHSLNGAAIPTPAKFVSRGNNLIEKNLIDIGFVDGQNGDKVGTVTIPLDPKLGPLQNNGGGILTRALLEQSPARDAGSSCVTNSSCGTNNPWVNLVTDQRGTDFPRSYAAEPTDPSKVDIGAFEAFYPVPVINSFVPNNWGTGAGAFQLTIKGRHFVANSVVKINDQVRSSTFVSNNTIKVQILATDVQTAGQLQITVTNPKPGGGPSAVANFPIIDCSYSLDPTSLNFNPSGGTGTTNVQSVNGCQWTAATSDSWIDITSGSAGIGPGSVSFSVDPNNGPQRTGTITIAGNTFTVTQNNGCVYTINPLSSSISPAGGQRSFNLSASNSTCTWEAVSNVPWITIATPPGSGSAQIIFNVQANTGPERVGKITVAGQEHTVTQERGCSYSLVPQSYHAVKGGASSTFSVNTGGGCDWTAVSNNPDWIQVTSGASGNGNGTVSFTVAANTGPARQGTITAGGQTFTITQDSGCTYTINPTSTTVPSGGIQGFQVTVTTAAGCEWTAVSNNLDWIQVTSGSTGTGQGTVIFNVSPNSGIARTGTLTIAGVNFVVNQENGCSFVISPTTANPGSVGGAGSFSVDASNNNCTWQAANDVSWITFQNGVNSGTGDGIVNYTVEPNIGPQRVGKITVGGQEHTVTQATGCIYTLVPMIFETGNSASSSTFEVRTAAGCVWTAVSLDPYVQVTAGGSGTGTGTVSFNVGANTGPYREGRISVRNINSSQVGQFTVKQANGCVYTINPASASFPSSGGVSDPPVQVTATNSACGWTVENVPSWITITSGNGGTGSGSVVFTVAANTGPNRSATITIAGKPFLVSQASGCIYTLTPTSATINPAGVQNSSFALTVNNQACGWSASVSHNWIQINGTTTGTGDKTISFNVLANTGPQRVGEIDIQGKKFMITQQNGCIYTILPEQANAPSGTSSGSFGVRAGPGCQWTAVTTDTWLSVTSGNIGSGDGTINYSVGVNNGPLRNGIITIQNPYSSTVKQFNVTQADGCTYAVDPTFRDFPSGGGTGQFAVAPSNPTCRWTAATNQPGWITITSGTSMGTGPATVTYTVAANETPYREGIIIITGLNSAVATHTVRQANGCQYTITPSSLFINDEGGTRSFTVASGVGCPWTAAPNVTWLTISSPTNGIGSGIGTVTFNVAATDESERQGTISVQDKVFTVNQLSLKVRNLNDNGAGSLRKAVLNANTMPHNDIITFLPSAEGFITLTTGELKVENNGSLEIKGLGADKIKITGNYSSRIFYSNQANLTISDLSVMHGNGVGIGSEDRFKYGGAIYVKGGTFSANRVSIIDNAITVPATGPRHSVGGGIHFLGGGPHQISNSTLFYNRSLNGGAFFNEDATVLVSNSTISENVGGENGGGIYSTGQTTLRNVTIYNNTAPANSGAGIFANNNNFNIGNTIIAGNNGPEITNIDSNFITVGNNLVGDAPGDAANTSKPIVYQTSDIRDTPPRLAPVDIYGGKTLTLALFPGSPAINKGNNALAATFDQRGAMRVIDGTTDIGAYEFNVEVTPFETTFPNATLGVHYGQAAVFTRRLDFPNNTDYLFDLASGSLPSGIILRQNEGVIFGTPSESGAFNFIVKAKYSDGMVGVNRYTLNVVCSGSINSSSQTIGANGGNIQVMVTSANACNWTATPNQNWISATSGAPGSGNGTVVLSVQPNTGASRQGTVSIAGNNLTINQDAAAPTCAYTLNPTSAQIPAAGRSDTINVATGDSCGWNAQSSAAWVTVSGGSTGNGIINYTVAANTGAARNATITAGGKTFQITQDAAAPSNLKTAFDYDGDAKADISVFRPSNGGWYISTSANGSVYGVGFGNSTDYITPADFDGDGKTDVAVFRPSNGGWYWLNSTNNSLSSAIFGQTGDLPAPADFDKDGKADVAVFRPSNGTWYRLNSGSGNSLSVVQFGGAEDKPTVGDFDGDGKADIAVFRASNGGWYRLNSSNNEFIGQAFGILEDKPVPADYDGDGKTDVAVYRPSTGGWYRLNSSDGQFFSAAFGISEDKPAPADFDGDRKADIAVYRPSTGYWYRLNSSNGQFIAIGFGIAEDIPTPNAFVR